MVQDSQANGTPLIAFFRKKFSQASGQIVAKCSTNSKGRTQAAQRAPNLRTTTAGKGFGAIAGKGCL
jgi:hypothetical protein